MSKSRIVNRLYIPCRIGVDEWLRVPSVPDVFAIGDCSGFLESTGKEVLPALAQVISRAILTHFSNMRAFYQSFYLKKWGICKCDRTGWKKRTVR
jgi:NADH dehydrogenase FAD-containing subunit